LSPGRAVADSDAVLDVPVAFIDTETTGLDPWSGDRIITIAVLHGRLSHGSAAWTVELDLQLDPQRPVPEEAARINGYSDEVLADLRRAGKLSLWKDVEPRVLAALAGRIPLAYNLPFDSGFILSEMGRNRKLDLKPKAGRAPWGLDPCLLAAEAYPGQRQRLIDVAERAGLAYPDAHTALSDARMAGQAMQHLLRIIRRRENARPTRTVGDVLELQNRRRSTVYGRR
jgi:DNA polymerase-3 subunit epsilon